MTAGVCYTCRVPASPPPVAGARSLLARPVDIGVQMAAPPTTARSSFVTLQPADPSGHIPGDADDGADFWGLGAALLGIVLIIVLARLLLRGGPDQQSRGER